MKINCLVKIVLTRYRCGSLPAVVNIVSALNSGGLLASATRMHEPPV